MSHKQILPVTKEMTDDILWWLHFLDFYNRAFVIPELYWTHDMLFFFQLMLVLLVVEVLYWRMLRCQIP